MPADRLEAVLSAIFYVVKLIAASQGIKPEAMERWAGDVRATRPLPWIEPTQEEKDARDDEEIRRNFAPFVKRMAAAQDRARKQ